MRISCKILNEVKKNVAYDAKFCDGTSARLEKVFGVESMHLKGYVLDCFACRFRIGHNIKRHICTSGCNRFDHDALMLLYPLTYICLPQSNDTSKYTISSEQIDASFRPASLLIQMLLLQVPQSKCRLFLFSRNNASND